MVAHEATILMLRGTLPKDETIFRTCRLLPSYTKRKQRDTNYEHGHQEMATKPQSFNRILPLCLHRYQVMLVWRGQRVGAETSSADFPLFALNRD